jgi:hypothetical protein
VGSAFRGVTPKPQTLPTDLRGFARTAVNAGLVDQPLGPSGLAVNPDRAVDCTDRAVVEHDSAVNVAKARSIARDAE